MRLQTTQHSFLLTILALFLVACGGVEEPTPTTFLVVPEEVAISAENTPTPIPTSATAPTKLPTLTASSEAANSASFCETATGIVAPDCEALVALYENANGPNWRLPADAGGWMQTTTPCSWYGVYCFGERVSALQLAGIGMEGTLTPALGTLSTLQILDVRDNQLSGNFPIELTQLASLETLTLYSNNFSGPLPGEIGRLFNLISVDLSNNNFSGEIPAEFGRISSLEALNLNYNQFTGPIPATFGETERLNWIDLSYNKLSGPVPEQLASVYTLNLEGNPDIADTARIDLPQFCTETTGIQIGDCEVLVSLYEDTNGANWQLPEDALPWLASDTPCRWYGVFCFADRVTTIQLPGVGMEGVLGQDLGRLTALQIFDVRDNLLTGGFPIELTQLPALATLTLYGNTFDGPLPREIGQLSNLVSIDLSNNSFSGEIPAEFGRISSLEALNLNYNNLSGTIPASLGEPQRLNWIDLSYNDLSGSVPPSLVNIDYLNVEGNPGIAESQTPEATATPSIQPSPTPLAAESAIASISTRPPATPPVTPPPNPTAEAIPTPTTVAVVGELYPLPPNPVVGETSGRFILSFSADKSPVSQGDEITLSWETQNTDDVYLTHTDFVYQQGVEEQELIPVPASGSYVYTLSEGRHNFNEVRFELLVNVTDFPNEEAASLTVALNCQLPRATILPANGACPSAPAIESAAVAQHFQSGLVLFVESENKLYVFKEPLNSYSPGTFEVYNNQYYGTPLELPAAPVGMQNPQDEIGWVWGSNPHLQAAIGYAIEAPIRYTTIKQSALYTSHNGEEQTWMLAPRGNIVQFYKSTYGRGPGLVSFWSYTGVPILPERPDVAFDCANVTEIPQSECNALVSFINVGGGSQRADFDWFKSNTPCQWEGLRCENGHIVKLGLYTIELTGPLSPEIAQLTQLNDLYLSNIGFSGAIPPELAELRQLTRLYLNNNQFEGQIPSQLANLPLLSMLGLGHNRLSGTIPVQLANMPSIEMLDLSNNQFTGALPIWDSASFRASTLYLGNNQFTGAIPASYGNLVSLQRLSFSETAVSGQLPASLGNLLNLNSLGFIGSQISGPIPESFARLSKMESLHFSGTQICVPTSGVVASWLQGIKHLSTADITCVDGNSAEITPTPAVTNFDCGNVTTIPTWECEALLAIYAKMGGPQWEEMPGWLTMPNPCDWMTVVCGSGHVTGLQMGNYQVVGNLAPEFGRFANLTELIVQSNNLVGPIPASLGQLTQLRNLQLSANGHPNGGLTGNIPVQLSNLTNLRHLILSSNSLSGNLPANFGRLTNLESLDLSYNNRLGGPLPTSMTDMTNLNIIRIDGTDFCNPGTDAFRSWLQTVNQVSGKLLDCS